MQKILISDLMNESQVKFGTSGARGLADNITDKVAYIYTKGFLQYLESIGIKKSEVAIAGDLRPSTPRIMYAVAKAVNDCDWTPIGGEFVPSPCVALYGIEKNIPAIMVTGSHIPDDRNGIKYNLPTGEILKEDELAIKAQEVFFDENLFLNDVLKNKNEELLEPDDAFKNLYIDRFLDAFPLNFLYGRRVVFYEHSAVGRDIIPFIYEKLGARVFKVCRTEKFIPVDTEAVREEDLLLAKKLSEEFNPDIIVSTDGDSDRPLVFDENGKWIPGDILGVLTAKFLGATGVCAPVSVNSVLESSQFFNVIKRTKIGSPYVIKAMQELDKNNRESCVVGYEANGGFLQENDIDINGKILRALPTRDAVIVHLALLSLIKEDSLSIVVSSLRPRCAISNRVQNFDTKRSAEILKEFTNNISLLKEKCKFLTSSIQKIDTTDGLRVYFDDGKIVHLRPSGNAPEFRCYVEADREKEAKDLLENMIKTMEDWKK